VCAALALGACRRTSVEPKDELVGAWLREPELARGFELRADGSLSFLGVPSASGLAWTLSHGELVLSHNDSLHVESHVSRLRVAKLEGDELELVGDEPELAGSYRRTRAEHVRGVVTYRERMALPDDILVEVDLTRNGVGIVARHVFAPHAQVPIPFQLSLVPSLAPAEYALEARIRDRERSLFATLEAVPVRPGDDNVELLLRSAR
jgi:type III secretion system (T3SS) chaperone YscW